MAKNKGKEKSRDKEKEPGAPPDAGDESRLLFVFLAGGEAYAVPPESIVEVLAKAQPAPLPFTPDWIEGVLSARGEIVPVLDLARYFQLSSEQADQRKRLLLLDVNGHRFTIWSDAIVGIESVDPETLEQPLSTLPENLLACTNAQFRLGPHLVYSIDLPRLLEKSREQVRRR